VLLNAGDGTFPTSVELPGGSKSTRSIAAADVDGDGSLDVLLGNHNFPSQVLLNAGDGTFPTSVELPGGSKSTRSIAAADVDGDGDLDLLLGNHNFPSQVLLNAGDGTFPTSVELPGGFAPTYSIAAADVDGDGDLDLLLGIDGSPSRLLPFIRCSQPGTARSRFGKGCVRCPSPSTRRDDHFDICYECEEHTELNVDRRSSMSGECSFCKPGSDRSVGAALCNACPRGKRQGQAGTFCVDCSPGTYAPSGGLFAPMCLPCELDSYCPSGAVAPIPCHESSNSRATNLARDEQCPHAPPHAPPPLPPHAPPHSPPTPPAALSAAARGMVVLPREAAILASSVLLIVALLVGMVCRRRKCKFRQTQTPQLLENNNAVPMQVIWSPGRWTRLLSPRLSNGSGGSVRADEPTQLEVVDFSTLTMGERIGQGGFATVWLARWQGNDLAVKVLNIVVENGRSSPAQEAMLQEVAILRRLRHPCICALFGHMRVDQRSALVLEYMAGGSLAAYLLNPRPSTCNLDPGGEAVQASVSSLLNGMRLFRSLFHATAPVAPQASLGHQLMEPLPRPHLADKKIRFGVQLASGLCFLHSHGILHHDVKTDNALLDATHTVCKLADFGLASLSLNYARHNSRNSVSAGGTLRYMAPERLKASERHVRESRDRGDGRGGSSGSSSSSLGSTLASFEDRADVYAFALLLWELTHERRAFEGMTGGAAALSASQGLRPQFLEPHLYGMIPALTTECWAQRPEDRPSMSTVLARLETCMPALSGTQGMGASSLETSPPTRPSCFSSSDEPLIAAKVGAQCSSKVGGIAEEAYFSSKVGEIAPDFEPWEGPANGKLQPLAPAPAPLYQAGFRHVDYHPRQP
jgi:serine/threonine protein kinase